MSAGAGVPDSGPGPRRYTPTDDFWRLLASAVSVAFGGNIVVCWAYGSREFKPFRPAAD